MEEISYVGYHDTAGQICRAIDGLAAWAYESLPAGTLSQELHDLVGAWCQLAGKVSAREERNMRIRMAAADLHAQVQAGLL